MFHILVVEDELWIRSAIVELAESAGNQYKVIGEASNGEEAWNLIFEYWPTILITDIMMPKKDGLWLIQQISDHQLPIVPIIISGYEEFEYARQAIHYGASEYLLKPVKEDDLKQALRRSAERLYSFRELHNYYARIQEYIERMHNMEQPRLMNELQDIVKSILRLKVPQMAHRAGILRIFSAKIVELVQGSYPAYHPPSLDVEIDEAVRRHFQILVEDWVKHCKDYTDQSVKQAIRRASEYMGNNYMKNITLTKMAEMSNISPSYFRYLLKQYTGLSFVNYLNQIRIDKAKQLLLESDIKIYEVSEMVGFASLSYFNRTFKGISGKTPNEYRKHMGI
jgi:two-component system response regulator YesN